MTDPSSFSPSSPACISPWSKHTLRITTPKSQYLGNDDKSGEKMLKHVWPPLPRWFHSSSIVSGSRGDIFIFGGVGDNGYRNDTWAIRLSGDPELQHAPDGNLVPIEVTTSLVEATGEAPSPRFRHASALVGGLLIVWGGITSIDGGRRDINDTCIYLLNLTTHDWTKLDIQPAPSARAGHAACVCGNKFIVFGGEDSSGRFLNDLWGLDLYSGTRGTPKWEQIEIALGSESPPERLGHTMIAYEKKLYMFGGKNNATSYNDTWCFGTTTRTWIELESTGSIPPPRAYHTVALVGDAVCVFGGLGERYREIGDTWSFRINEQRWYKFPCINTQPSERRGHIAATIGRRVLVVGGMSNQEQSGDVATVHILDTGDSVLSFGFILKQNTRLLFRGTVAIIFCLLLQLLICRTLDLIDYPDQGEEITLKSTPHIKLLTSGLLTNTSAINRTTGLGSPKNTFQVTKDLDTQVVETKDTDLEADSTGAGKLAVIVDSPRLAVTLGSRSEETAHFPNQGTATLSIRDTITGAMSVTEILRYLVIHGCREISKDLDILHVTEYPVSTGGFGDVYCVTLRNGDRLGVKCVRMLVDSTLEGKSFLKHAAHELYVWSKCKHPNILELLGVMLFRGQIAMVSPWLDSGHLRWFLSHNQQIDRCALCTQIADGVDYLHKQSIVHGDLKPENILLSKDHTPKLTDFGNAALAEYTLQFTHSNTAQNMSLRWAAPEIIKEETKSTQASDIYSLGLVSSCVVKTQTLSEDMSPDYFSEETILQEAITGAMPYAAAKDPAIVFKVVAGKIPTRSETHIPTGIEQADRLWSMLTSCWAYNPYERPKAWEVRNMMAGITPRGLLSNIN
ncbi:unnamed protein product [Rhizoctonia solani]|uniref:Protein kinase domain-containing protein n=1 Tax=Rhizoctonia solani TaxID=456999 RepID=A0A8H3G9S6_9AGAM|nr:unnamed protein product [Rhizoctonia solani]